MGRPPRVQGLRRHAPGGKSVEAARAVCASKLAIRLRSVVSVPSSACEPSTMRRRRLHVDALNNARGHSRRVTGSQSVLGQEAMSGGLIVDGHELSDLRAPPGSTMVMPMPKESTSCATDSTNPSIPHHRGGSRKCMSEAKKKSNAANGRRGGYPKGETAENSRAGLSSAGSRLVIWPP